MQKLGSVVETAELLSSVHGVNNTAGIKNDFCNFFKGTFIQLKESVSRN